MIRTALAEWIGGLRDGHGILSTESGMLSDSPYSFATRFEGKAGTNPEELIAAAHAGCFTMALSAELERERLKPVRLHTDADATLEKRDGQWTISKLELRTFGDVPGATGPQFQEAARRAKEGCPVSRVLRAEIALMAELLNEGQSRPRPEKRTA